jgi:hypothetical protein
MRRDASGCAGPSAAVSAQAATRARLGALVRTPASRRNRASPAAPARRTAAADPVWRAIGRAMLLLKMSSKQPA